MKKGVLILLLVLSATLAAADNTCNLGISLISQDPYPATPGDYVKLVFQVDGIDSPDCNDISFELYEKYPIEFNPGESTVKLFKKIDYIKDFDSSLLVPYKVRINEDAVDGTNPIEVRAQSKNSAALLKTFDLEIDDSRADFEVHVSDYDYATQEITIEILNIENSDVEAVTIEIPKQDNIVVKGNNRIVVGDLDSNEYTSADFEAIPKNGEISVTITYSDSIHVRRTLEKTVTFDDSYFTNRIADQSTRGIGTYIFWLVVIGGIGYWYYKRRKKKK